MAKNNFFSNVKEAGEKFVAWLKSLFDKGDAFTVKYAPIAINVVNAIKDFNESDNADIVEAIVTKVGGKAGKIGAIAIPILRKWLKANLGEVLDGLGLTLAVAKEATVSEKAIAAKKYIESFEGKYKGAKWTGLSTMIADKLIDGKVDLSEAFAIIATMYNNYMNEE